LPQSGIGRSKILLCAPSRISVLGCRVVQSSRLEMIVMKPFSIAFPCFARVRPARSVVPKILLAAAAASLAGAASAHEAWLLTPEEVSELSRMPVPEIFTSTGVLALAALVGCVVVSIALAAEDRLRPLEMKFARPLEALAPVAGPVAVRLGLATMLCLASIGGLPRHGTALWTQPTLLVPDMQLSLAPAWSWLAPVEAAVGLMLLTGLLTRIAGLIVIALGCLGLVVFGWHFLSYAAHFAAPGILLLLFGSGGWSLDRILGSDDWAVPSERLSRLLWPMSLFLVGAAFVYLAVTVKLTQPTLLIAILEHGNVPTLGLPLPVAALVMAGVELLAGCLLAAGRLVRPVALFLIGAFTFLSVTIGETPLFHANLYGACLVFLLAGAALPQPGPACVRQEPIAA
jgi:uncharacterized membrane protein YphA (DoxX/SURF4 family)